MTRALLAAAVVLAVLPVLAACGEDKEATFAEDYRPLNKQILALGSDVGEAISGARGKDNEALADEFGKLAQRTGELSQKVDELEPPDDLTASTDDLVESMGDAQDALRDIEKAAGDNDPPAARKATIQLVTSSKDLSESRRKLESATR